MPQEFDKKWLGVETDGITAEQFVHRVANHCYYDFDSLKECESCSRKGKCWGETIKLLKEESA